MQTMHRSPQENNTIQAVLFSKQEGWTADKARKWLASHNFTPIKRVHATKHFLRYRLHEPHKFNNFTTEITHNGIELIIGYYRLRE